MLISVPRLTHERRETVPDSWKYSRLYTLFPVVAMLAAGALAFQQSSVYYVLSITPFSNGAYNISLMSVSTFYVHNATVTSQQLTGISTDERVTETISSNYSITLQLAPVGTPVTQLGQFQVQSITQNGDVTDDVKLLNPTTGYVHSVTCIFDVLTGISVGDLVNEFVDSNGEIRFSESGQTGGSSSLLKLLGDCLCGNDTEESPSAGEPIGIAGGNVFYQVTDYTSAGPNKLTFSRYYNSLADPKSLAVELGNNWRGTYDRYLRIASSSSLIAERADGQELGFTLKGSTWASDTDVDLQLTQSGSSWTLTDGKDTIETYLQVSSNEAVLTSIQARNGYTRTLQYDGNNRLLSVTDSFGLALSFTYNGALLQSVATPDGLVLTYGYNAGGNGTGVLASVSYSTTPVTSQSYLYENSALPFALTGVIDEDGNRFTTWTYDSTGRGLSSQHGPAGLVKIAYNDSDGSRTVTNALGQQEVYRFTKLQGVPKVSEIDRAGTASTASATRRFTYDSNGYLASQTDWNGNAINYVNDVHGQPVSIVEAAGSAQARTTTIAYHATLHLPLKIVQPGLTTTFVYDASGNLLTLTQTDTTTTSVPYSTNGQVRTFAYSWSNALVASVQSPRTDVTGLTQFTYDGSGALISVTNALGQVIQVAGHMPGGLPQTIVDANGVTTQITYDARLRPLSNSVTTGAGQLTTSYAYDPAGNLLGVTLPDGSALTNTYDVAHRLTGVTDLFEQNIAYTLDAAGDRTQSNVKAADSTVRLKHSASFDALGRLVQDIAGAGQTTRHAYDSNGNTLTVTDGLNRATGRSFDALNRLTRITDPAGRVTTIAYDSLDRPVSVTDANNGATKYVYDGFGNLIQQVSPDSGTTIYHYDSGGNLVQKADGAGAVTNYTYDALDRPLGITYPADAGENVTYTYDEPGHGFGVGRLTTMTDAAGQFSRSYDERGNLLNETRTSGAVSLSTSYGYDPSSRISSITYPSGWTATYNRDAMGRITGIAAQAPGGATALTVASGILYQPFGPMSGLAAGNGVTETRGFDPDYRLTTLTAKGTSVLENLSYSYDPANNVLSVSDGSPNGQKFGYDTLNRLTSASGSYGSFTYSYDGVGNRLSQTLGNSTTSYSYTASTNRLTRITAGSATQTIGYTVAGNINSIMPNTGAATTMTYNQSGRLASIASGTQQVAGYTYDGFGQRLGKTNPVSGATFREYDYSGHLLEETDGEGNPQADYIYLGDRPIAVLQPDNGNLYWIQGDRLDTPQMATDGSQAIAWTGAYQPFGKMSVPSTLITQDLRMPGQEFDAETGWYHNGFRDYMPDLGRYLETDVIGLAGGLNTYAYAGGNPLRVVDPLGLDINLFPGDTAEYAGAQWYTQSAAAKGTVNVYAHGGYGWWDDPSIARAQNGDPTAPGDINKMVNLILSDPNYTNIGSVYLRICHGAEKGKTRLSLAQQIKDALAAKGFKGSVYAWSGQVETAPPGGTSVQLGIGPYLPLPPTKF